MWKINFNIVSMCNIQALLRGALSQQSAVILVCMAIDRYMCALHPDKYHQHSSKKVNIWHRFYRT